MTSSNRVKSITSIFSLQEVSKPIYDLATLMDESLPDGAEKSAGLRKLLEAKDALVRAKLG
ncbi:TPA: hypothetical protein IBV97_003242 [Escherichia coli]|nr:hypothetical protein [Salmonella enterica]EFH8887965.1 hypothetical protein [Escherichia coli]HAU4331967.1 hypothetical protein [Citrobacter freundii]EDC2435130.1 hypothetical protein [Salmonella enterica]EFN5133041.1 hypothetical protein [Escherichia coli]